MSAFAKVVDPIKAVQFFLVVGKLKRLKRTGWVNHGIHLPESVADHMYRMSMLSFLIVDPNVNKDKLMKVCMVHDLAEAIVGDITPHDGVSKEDKRNLEETALRKIIEDIEYPEIAAEILELWLEYEEGESAEAHLAREFDKFEMILQALEYEEIQPEKKLDSFFRSTEGYFHNHQVLAWVEVVLNNRKDHHERLMKSEEEPKST